MPYLTDFIGRNVTRRLLSLSGITIGFLALLMSGPSAIAQSITPKFDVPQHSRGIAWAWDKIWVGGVAERGEWIWAYDPETGALLDSLPAPIPDCLSLEGHDGGLVYLSPRSSDTYLISEQGVVSFENPFDHFAGLGSDGTDLWGATYFDPQGTLFKMNTEGQVLQSVPFGGTQTRDMAFLRGRLYVADQLTQNVRVIDPANGRLIRNLAAPGRNPSGVASDNNGIWLLDEGDAKASDQVYYIDIRPEGGIRLSALEHNYGSVVENESRIWNLWIYNDGPRSTRLVNFVATPEEHTDIFVPHVWNFPQTIEPGDSVALGISFVPAYQDSVHIQFAFTYDLDRAENVVVLHGKGVGRNRNIFIPLRNLNFGLCYYGQGARNSNLRYLTIENAGGEPLTIRDIRFSNNAFSTGAIEFPHTFIRPGAYRIPIFFRPVENREIRATGTIISDDPDSPEINFSITGQGSMNSYPGGELLWNNSLGDAENDVPYIRAVQPIDDVTGDGLADVVIAANDHTISCFHAASTLISTQYLTYYTNTNPWRSGLIPGSKALCETSDLDRDDTRDLVFGLDGGAMTVTALSGNTGQEIWVVDTHNLPGDGGIPIILDASGDFTNDGFNDVVVAAVPQNEDYTTQALFLINGRTSRVAWFAELPAPPKDFVTLADLSGDAIPDIVVVLTDGQVIGIDGAGGHQIFAERVGGDVRVVLTIPDINEDGSMDVIIATYNDGIYTINGSNGSEIWHIENLDEVTLMVTMGDLNGNGSTDVVYGTIHSFFMALDGETGERLWYEPFQVGARPLSLSWIEDLSDDSKSDYLVGTADGRLFCLSGNGRTTLWSYSNVGEGHGFSYMISSRDIDGNGQMDVFGAMDNGMFYAFAGSFIGLAVNESEASLLPGSIILNPAYPNPFNSSITIPFTLDSRDEVGLRIFDIAGREVFASAPLELKAGNHRLVWNGTNLTGEPASTGLYFVRIESSSGNIVERVQLLR